MTSFILIWALWFLSEILTNRLLRSGKVESKESDKGSIHVIWMTIGAANTAGILLVIFLPLPYGYSMVPAYSGLALIVIGMCIRFLSIRALGPFFTVNVAIHSDHRLKTDGIYRLVRHPSYSGSLVSFLGFGLSLNNWLSPVC
jgi:protein-S-isoprenylcysteine O-methyltransferase Ste14